MIAIYTQNRQAVWNFADISRFHVTGNGTGIQAVAKNGAGGELARYKNREQCTYILEMLMSAFDADERTFTFPTEKEIDEIDEWIKAFRESGHKESAADACFIQDGIIHLPSAQPERKKGKWVEVAVTDGYDKDGIKTWISVMQCDQCGFIVNAVEGHMAQYNYCPNCGAQMMGGES